MPESWPHSPPGSKTTGRRMPRARLTASAIGSPPRTMKHSMPCSGELGRQRDRAGKRFLGPLADARRQVDRRAARRRAVPQQDALHVRLEARVLLEALLSNGGRRLEVEPGPDGGGEDRQEDRRARRAHRHGLVVAEAETRRRVHPRTGEGRRTACRRRAGRRAGARLPRVRGGGDRTHEHPNSTQIRPGAESLDRVAGPARSRTVRPRGLS